MSQLIISVSGLRGIVGDTLTPEVAMRYAAAFADTAPPGPFVLSRDGRANGPPLADAVETALRAMGRTVINAGIAATPTTGVLVKQYKAAGGIQVSASHNPPQYNGLKLFNKLGRVVPADEGQQVKRRYESGAAPPKVDTAAPSQPLTERQTTEQHCALVLANVDVERIRQRKFRVLLDANHGAGALLGRRLLQDFGCDLTIQGAEPTGQFAHPPEPTADNLTGVCAAARDANCDVAFCQDPDADRLAIIDQQGRYLGEEYTLALCLDHVLRAASGPVVANCATSSMTADVAKRHAAPFYRSAVGEANVIDLMIQHHAVFGGEGNGGPIDPRVGYVRDSFVGMALVLDALAERGLTISQLAGELPQYAIHKTTAAVDQQHVAAAFARLQAHFAEAQPDDLDGLRLDWPDKWLLVRASNTEPIVRVIAEAKSADEAQRLCQQANAILTGA